MLLSKDVLNLVKKYQTSLGGFTILGDEIVWYNGKNIIFWCEKFNEFHSKIAKYIWYRGFLYRKAGTDTDDFRKYKHHQKQWSLCYYPVNERCCLDVQIVKWKDKYIRLGECDISVSVYYNGYSVNTYNLRKDVRNTLIVHNGKIFVFSYKGNQIFDLDTETFLQIECLPFEYQGEGEVPIVLKDKFYFIKTVNEIWVFSTENNSFSQFQKQNCNKNT